MLTTRSSVILVVNRRTATRFAPTTLLRTPVTSLVVPKSGTHNRGRTSQVNINATNQTLHITVKKITIQHSTAQHNTTKLTTRRRAQQWESQLNKTKRKAIAFWTTSTLHKTQSRKHLRRRACYSRKDEKQRTDWLYNEDKWKQRTKYLTQTYSWTFISMKLST